MTDFLYDIPENPKPEGGTSGFFTARDGKKLRYAHFPAIQRPLKGTVVLLSGRNECIEKYFETIRDLAARGFGVAIFDWRGQGASDRVIRNPAKGHINSFKDHEHDLESFFSEIVLPDCRGPFYILAHSTGALVALQAAPSLANRVQRMMLLTPFLAPYKSPLSVRGIRRLAASYHWTGLGRLPIPGARDTRVPEPFWQNKVTSDPARYERNSLIYQTYPQLATGAPTMGWVRAAAMAIAHVQDPAFMAALKVPVLLIAAGADTVVSNYAIEAYAHRLRVGSMLTIHGARHELLQEADLFREQLLGAFDAFIPGSDAPAV
ncbi:lysophospholipase [Pseudaminobacter salicylatoxidans]|uniref:Lysophospholipase n=1 Tax=Pseudaminobacter salicylatoxidans TaxID=93369 RepID=A0A316BM61_PSESE|nr:alpha/beta hydrolase [Pseudaminobacter salicylatoxidans]PWJ73865.1 lysophospholipase [Pseudaminobacter salicylatoxidans]